MAVKKNAFSTQARKGKTKLKKTRKAFMKKKTKKKI
jgi:hypothetical protein